VPSPKSSVHDAIPAPVRWPAPLLSDPSNVTAIGAAPNTLDGVSEAAYDRG
jgi:hypothetical protein